MSNAKMLIDATHPEETRVVVQRNGRVEEFDFESAARKLLRGNIYLAKVTRVEPSLQAAFVDYGGNRHGFLAFNEIHPDYYQIPVADRQALLEEEAAAEAELEAAADRRAEALARRQAVRGQQHAPNEEGEAGDTEGAADEFIEGEAAEAAVSTAHIVDVEEEDDTIEEVGGEPDEDGEPQTIALTASASDERISEPAPTPAGPEDADEDTDHVNGEPAADAPQQAAAHHEAEDDEADDSDNDEEDDDEEEEAESGQLNGANDVLEPHPAEARDERSGAEAVEEAPARQRRRPRNYKIQEVIKRRQVILVQVVKEERGNKGAALTTYLSLAGRYTVLMPNTARGGGISRKITNPQDRKRLKAIAQELEVPEGMGLIIRTAGAARTKQEIKRDFEYLLRLWESVRELTLQSTAPSLVYEEGDLIKRSIRDLYNKDVDEVVVAGDGGYQEASEFMRMLMPSHARNVVPYKEPTPLFTRYGVERQLNAMFQPQVTLRSGGYIVINQTEALVAIDVNSGKSTREFSIEETALATNLEASDEIARQLKLRDLAGLIVIDFIDMEEKRNNRAVERRLKDALRFDRARIQLGRISHFGLMEMSRQRLRTGVLEGSTSQCPHCQGTGIIRSTESIALAVLRGLEDAITAGANCPLIGTTTQSVALYILNSKRTYITEMEARHGHAITVLGSERVQGANFTVERGVPSANTVRRPERAAVNMNWGFEGEGDDEAPGFEAAGVEIVGDNDDGEMDTRRERFGREGGRSEGDDGGRRGRRRRRGRGRGGRDRGDEPRGGYRDDAPMAAGEEQPYDDAGLTDDEQAVAVEGGEAPDERAPRGDRPAGEDGGERGGRRRRRGRRGGRRGRDRNRDPESGDNAPNLASDDADNDDGDAADANDDTSDTDATELNGAVEETSQVADEEPQRTKPSPERPRRERLWDVPSAANATDDAAPPPTATSEVSVEETAVVVETPQPARRRRHELDSTETKIERVVLGTGDEPAKADEQATPQRKGWWQRRFGGE